MKHRSSELTDTVHETYQNTRIFLYHHKKYRFTRFTQNARFTRKNKAISLASDDTKVFGGHENNSERNEMILHSGEKKNWNKVWKS